MDATLILGDSLHYTESLEANSVDVILTDPPYNLARYSTGNIHLPGRKSLQNDLAVWDMIPFDPATLVQPFQRILKPTGTIFAFTSYNLLGAWHTAFDPVFDTFQYIVWHKTNPPIKIRKAGFLNSCELIVCLWNKGHTWHFGRQSEMHNFIESPICMGRERLDHPTQKPVRVLSRLLQWASNPGDLVYDPYMGVASVGEAALRLNRRFIGVELEPYYYQQAKKRLDHLAFTYPLEFPQ